VAIAVLHADAHLLAVDKPAGRLVIPGRGAPERTIQEELEAEHGRLWIVHRLDRGTTGVLVLARSAAAHRALNLAFDRREVEKRYFALVRGAPPSSSRLDAAIAPARRGRMRPARPGDAKAKPAVTEVRTVEAFPARADVGWPPLALVEAVPETGRTHQIRVHLAWAGTPLAVDPDYGEAEPLRAGGEVVLARTPLHAASLALRHPETGERMVLAAPMPEDMARAIAVARGG
jgi:tRNA pseudouridine32 synthase / 23S rRNA pseudouridine746 synthase